MTRLLRWVGSGPMLAAMAAGVTIAAVFAAAFTLRVHKDHPDQPLTPTAFKAALVAFAVIYAVGEAVDRWPSRKAVQ